MDKLLLSRDEAAELLNLVTRSVDYLVAEGRLPSRKFGKRRLIPREAIERIAKKRVHSDCAKVGRDGEKVTETLEILGAYPASAA
jgi:excisionase family DNA binding protein